jgi:putative ABC transport system ATP-binding protein
LAGLDEPDGGTVRIGGELMSRRAEGERASIRARKVGMLFQSGNLLDHLTVEQNMRFVQRLIGAPDRERITALLDAVDLRHRATSTPPTLSGGEAARAGLAVALANQPIVVLADEPTGELDDASADRIMQLLHRYARGGAAVLLVTHNPRAASFADREISLLDGRLAP